MIGTAAAYLGYRMHVFCPDPDSPAFHVAGKKVIADRCFKEHTHTTMLSLFAAFLDDTTVAEYNDKSALDSFAASGTSPAPALGRFVSTKIMECAGRPAWDDSGRCDLRV